MILKKGQILDIGDPLHLRIKKCAEIQQSLKAVEPLLLQFTKQFQDFNSTQIHILTHLKVIYGTNSSYSEIVGRVSAYLEQCLAIGIEECAKLESIMQQYKKAPVAFTDLTDSVKEYFESDIKFQRQQKKLSEMKNPEHNSGCMVNNKAKNYRKTQQLLEEMRAVRIIKSERVVETSAKVNGVKYDKINPATQHFFNACLLGPTQQLQQLNLLKDYERVLTQKEKPVLLDQFFMDIVKFRLVSENNHNAESDSKVLEKASQEGNATYLKPPSINLPVQLSNRFNGGFARDPIEQSKNLSCAESVTQNSRVKQTEVIVMDIKKKEAGLIAPLDDKKKSARDIPINKDGSPVPDRQFMVLKNGERENLTKSNAGSPIELQFKYKEKISNNLDNKGNAIETALTKTTKDDSAQLEQQREINPFISAIDKSETRQKSKEPTSRINQANVIKEDKSPAWADVTLHEHKEEVKGLSKKEEELIYKLKIKSDF